MLPVYFVKMFYTLIYTQFFDQDNKDGEQPYRKYGENDSTVKMESDGTIMIESMKQTSKYNPFTLVMVK